MKSVCPKCKGAGVLPREGAEADSVLHPVISFVPGLCDRCGGACVAELTEAEIKALNATG